MSQTSNSQSTIPGMKNPTLAGMLAGNPKDSANMFLMQTANKLANLNKTVGGTRRRKVGGGTNLIAPQFPMYYKSTNGPTQTPNAILKQLSQNTVQQFENSKYDKYATMKGGNPNWKWGCYSGGRKKRMNKTKKHRRSRRRANSRKYKSRK
jgi:hypothetical protein